MQPLYKYKANCINTTTAAGAGLPGENKDAAGCKDDDIPVVLHHMELVDR